MRSMSLKLVLALGAISLVPVLGLAAGEPKGRKIQVHAVDGPHGRAHRASTIVDTDVYTAAAVILDGDAYVEWMPGITASRFVDSLPPSRRYLYLRNRGEGLVEDRDVILRYDVDMRAHDIVISFRNVQGDVNLDRQGAIQMAELRGEYVLSPLDDGRTEVAYQVRVDPGGSVPAALAQPRIRRRVSDTLSRLATRIETFGGRYADVAEYWRREHAKARRSDTLAAEPPPTAPAGK